MGAEWEAREARTMLVPLNIKHELQLSQTWLWSIWPCMLRMVQDWADRHAHAARLILGAATTEKMRDDVVAALCMDRKCRLQPWAQH